jgi:hypothetical protein
MREYEEMKQEIDSHVAKITETSKISQLNRNWSKIKVIE